MSRVVKEEIVDESTVLPVFNGRVISWVKLLNEKPLIGVLINFSILSIWHV